MQIIQQAKKARKWHCRSAGIQGENLHIKYGVFDRHVRWVVSQPADWCDESVMINLKTKCEWIPFSIIQTNPQMILPIPTKICILRATRAHQHSAHANMRHIPSSGRSSRQLFGHHTAMQQLFNQNPTNLQLLPSMVSSSIYHSELLFSCSLLCQFALETKPMNPGLKRKIGGRRKLGRGGTFLPNARHSVLSPLLCRT